MTGDDARRMFVACPLPTAAVAELTELIRPLLAAHPGLRWVAPDRWHLTLTFLGNVDSRVVPDIQERLGRAAARTPPLTLQLTHGGRFGGRVLWVAVDGDLPGLRRLAERTTAAARRAGVDVESRRYRPHLTLARVARPTDLRPAVEALATHLGPEWTASEIALIHSTLGAQPRYRTVASFPMGTP